MLVRYGFHGFHALACLLDDEIEREQKTKMFRDYVGQALWDIDSALRAFGKVKQDMIQYIDYVHPRKIEKVTVEEVKKHILDKLLG